MALKGTLKDFGISEILQLIGQQAKSGVLHLRSKEDEIHIVMSEGNVVSAEYAGRKARERLGNLLVRAEIITQGQLREALEAQKRSLRRLGDILMEMGAVSRDDLRQMTTLQTTETVFKLFHWRSGTYAFEPGDVEYDPETMTPMRAESVLMEGFRQVDEWPLVRKKITSAAMTFERLEELAPEPPPAARAEPAEDDVDTAFDGFGGGAAGGGSGGGRDQALTRSDRKVYGLAVPGRSVEKIVDLSRLGEFETCKALLNLVTQGLLRPVAPPRRSAAASVGAYTRDWKERIKEGVARVLATAAIAAVLAFLAFHLNDRGLSFADPGGGRALRDDGVRRFVSRAELSRLRGALEIYRLEKGEYPGGLSALVETGLATPADLKYPWAEDYYYRRKEGGGFVLLPPAE
ncbi:MAG TPA: DUF4388 domain-containing protein [Anaeromyxobacteraceae bacterium]|jgi:hypothetical protein|nr:DUF4388 domain-containing protein [Anaeromyxobacteraceae bacterium]